jgi:UDPglucose 6-dehydrogenase
MDIAVIGTGYVGLVTGAVFAELGNHVICVDKMPERIEMLMGLKMPFFEPGLREMVERNMEDGRLQFSTDTGHAVKSSEIIFIAVGTPPKETGETDLSQVESAAAEIGKNYNDYKIIVNKSTVPVGTGDLVREIIQQHKPPELDIHVVSNPEFLSEGSAVADALNPDRIVIGAPNQQVAMKLIELYSILEKPMIITSVRSAEMIKYASNAFLATKVSFINSVANLCETVGADVDEVRRGMGLDERIGPKFLRAGVGYGGSCFPKDTESLLNVSRSYGAGMQILEGTIAVNKMQPVLFVNKLESVFGSLDGKLIGVLGLSFKPNTDDIREASALYIIDLLHKRGARVQVYDPMAMDNVRRSGVNVTFCEDEYDAAAGTDAVLVLTEWNRFRQLNFSRLKRVMAGAHLFDGRNIYDPAVVRRYGLSYHGVGRQSVLLENS